MVRGGGRGEYIQWRKGSKQAQVNVCGVAYFVGIGCGVFVINLLWCMKEGSLSYVLARNSHEKIF